MSRYQLTRTKYLNDAELAHLMQVLTRNSATSARDCLMIKLALATGARAQELLNITHADIDASHRSVYVRGLKGSSDREIPLDDAMWAMLSAYAGQGTGLLFNVKYRRLVEIWDAYRPCKKTFHSLRHTFAIELYKRTRDLRLVQVALGHRNIANTMIYSEYVYNQTELRDRMYPQGRAI